jgi:hypothetical protein
MTAMATPQPVNLAASFPIACGFSIDAALKTYKVCGGMNGSDLFLSDCAYPSLIAVMLNVRLRGVRCSIGERRKSHRLLTGGDQ